MLTVGSKNASLTDWAGMPMSDLSYGCAMDCDFTYRLRNNIREEMESDGVTEVYDKVLKDVLVTFAGIESRGIRANVGHLDKLDSILTDEIDKLEKELLALSPIKEISLTKPRDVMGVLFLDDGFGLEPVEWTKTKLPKMNKECLEQIIDRTHANSSSTDTQKKGADFLEKYLLWKSRFKLHNDYVKNLKKALDFNQDGRIYCQYNFSATKTGRLSNSKYSINRRELNDKGKPVNKKYSKGVSFHTLPRPDKDNPDSENIAVNLRRIMAADKGNVFLYGDYSQAEVRVLAHCCQDTNLINAFYSGEDLHTYTASLVFNKPIEFVTSDERQTAKSVTFLILYGGGPRKLAGQIKQPMNYCKKIFAAYFNAFPGIKKWIDEQRESISRTGYAVSLFGRRRRLENVNSPSKKYRERALRQGVNFIIQSSASDLMLHAIWRVDTLSKKFGIDLEIVATVHDSLEVQAPLENYEKAFSLMKYCMSDTSYLKKLYGWEFSVPFVVDMEGGVAFGDGIEAEFDEKHTLLNSSSITEYVKKNAA